MRDKISEIPVKNQSEKIVEVHFSGSNISVVFLRHI